MVKVKGIRDGILITLESAPWPKARASLMDHVEKQTDFLKGASITLDVGNHVLNASEMGKLRDALSELGLSMRAVLSNSSITKTTAQTLGLATRISKPPAKRTIRARKAQQRAETGILVKRTLRSGVSLQHPGHITVLGDVNPGAEVIAGGNIVVWGRLRGVAHAGAEGDENACVCAVLLAPTQLRIAGQISIPPKQSGTPPPEIAFIRNGQVVAEPWNSKPK